MANTKICTFYSYKGGSGRSTTTINTLLHLIDEIGADPTQPILLVDADLESSGLTFFFHQENRFWGGEELAQFSAFDANTIFANTTDPKIYFEEDRNISGIEDSLVDLISEHFENAKERFDGVTLPESLWSMLGYIVEQYNLSKSSQGRAPETEILKFFDLPLLLFTLNKCHKSDLSHEEKIREKERIIRDFLPSTTYTDISAYFGKPYGTVRFLGVDTKRNVERLARNTAISALNQLKRACQRKGYKAILFDSGAGTQSSAHLFQQASDVIVCCMRPTLQFAKGTKIALRLYRSSYRTNEGKCAARVILLPTAVPQNDSMEELRKNCFEEIKNIVNEAPEVIDDSFCTPETALCEVSLFKWREQILGVDYDPSEHIANAEPISEEIKRVTKPYRSPETLPEDAKKAYNTYKKVAEKIAGC